MNNLLRSAVRKHALANGIATAKWNDGDFNLYAKSHGITERDNLKTVAVSLAAELDNIETVKIEASDLVAVPKGNVEAAIAELIAATQGNAKLDEARVLELISQHSKAPLLHAVEITNADTGITVSRKNVHKDYALVLAHIAAKVDVALVGPAGSFKSTSLKNIAEDLGLAYYIVSSPQARSEIVGYNDAHSNYVRTPMREAYEHGGLIVIEEFDGSAAKALLSCNNLVANETADFPDGMVKRHPDFICVMAGNTFGTGASRQYVGRTQIDAATLDRFAFIEFGYDEVLEVVVAKSFHDAPAVTAWVAEVQAFRAKVEKAGIRHVVSPRASIMGAKLLKQGLSREVIVKSVLHKGLTADQIKQLSR